MVSARINLDQHFYPNDDRIKVAFIKFCGMATGGTEKVLQTIAANLDKNKFLVDFYYCDSAPYIGSDFVHPDNDISRMTYCYAYGVRLIKFSVKNKDVTTPTHDWIGSDFFDIFKESRYDVIQTGRAGHPEYPFTKINNTPIVDSIHLAGMAENKANVYKTVLISKDQRDKWVQAGGPRDRSVIIPNPVEIPDYTDSYIQELKLRRKFVFGMHQRDDDGIFSNIPLEAYKKIENDKTHFILLGGSDRYKKQAEDLGIKNITFLPTVSELEPIHKFLNTLKVYAHGRADGEQCSCAIIEALAHNLPVISHTAPSLGHMEQIGDAGRVVSSSEVYSLVMTKMIEDKNFYKECSVNAKKRYESTYGMDAIISEYSAIYEEIKNG
tara:strand:- start:24 stop:1166 length:1143 start_codon:yes stop_codon:yes gene_type:complete